MLFEQIRSGGCLSYLVGDDETCASMIVDPHLEQLDRYLALTTERGMRVHYVVETHTHADHFSSARELARQLGARVVMHRHASAPFVDVRVDDGETLVVGKLRVRVMHTPGHTIDSTCLVLPDRVLTGDTLLIGGTGRTDLPTGDPDALYDSLFGKLLQLDDSMRVYPAHDYKDRASSTIGAEKTGNARLQKTERADFVALMRGLDLKMPQHLSEALRTNRTGGKTVAQLLAEASREIAFVGMADVAARLGSNDFVLLDVREKEAFDSGHLPGARHLPRGQLELRVDRELPDPSLRILTYCQFGRISTLAAATLRTMGYTRAVALDGGYEAWIAAGYPTTRG
ncbi:MAG TPA: rhodanese-like domain-containing protein [Kofleriaceae bacterium]|nr:rhodanese-like domain-containing protein [Kofleriaceae bacterium]